MSGPGTHVNRTRESLLASGLINVSGIVREADDEF